MHLTFHDKEIRKVCEHQRIASLRLGRAGAEDLMLLLTDLVAAKSLGDLPHEVRELESDELALDLESGGELIVKPNAPASRRGVSEVHRSIESLESIQIIRVRRHE